MDTDTARTELGFSADETLTEKKVKAAYREKAKEYHPDTSDHPNARERFLKVKQAKKALITKQTAASSKTSSTDSGSSSSTNTTSSSTQKTTSRTSGRTTSRTSASGQSSTGSQSSWRDSKVDWTSEADPDSSWRSNKAESSTRGGGTNETDTSSEWPHDNGSGSNSNTGSNSGSGTESGSGNSSGTETDTGNNKSDTETVNDPDSRVHKNWRTNDRDSNVDFSGESTVTDYVRARYRSHRESRDWNPFYMSEGEGYNGVEAFPQRPAGRSRIFHLLVMLVGIIATALLGRGQYEALRDAAGGSRAVEPQTTVENVFLTPAANLLTITSFRLVTALSFLRFPRVYLPVTGGIIAPLIVDGMFWDLGVPEAAGVATAGSGVLMAGVALGRYNTDSASLPTSDWWVEAHSPEHIWAPGGAILLLCLHGAVALLAKATAGHFYDAFLFYLIMIAPSVTVALLAAFMPSPKALKKPGMLLLGTVVCMPVLTAVIHLPEFEPVMPGILLFGEGYYPSISGFRATGAIMGLWAASWHLFVVAAIELLCMGWEIGWHKKPEDQPIPYTVWATITAGGVGLAVWIGLEAVQTQVALGPLHEALVVGMILVAYVYGVTMDPIAD